MRLLVGPPTSIDPEEYVVDEGNAFIHIEAEDA